MKKVILMCTLLLCLILLCACGNTVEEKQSDDPSVFIEIEYNYNWSVVYHRESKVMYVVSRGSYNQGTFTLLVNADGTPMIYGEGGGR